MTGRTDQSWLTAIAISMGCHLLFLGTQWLQLASKTSRMRPHDLAIVYAAQAAQLAPDVQRRLTQLEAPRGPSMLPPAMTGSIRVPDRPAVEVPMTEEDLQISRAAVVDLTNLVQAAQGNPVLLSYFSAIREQIQRTANRQTWMAGSSDHGLIYVSFLLAATGQIQRVVVARERSVASATLQRIAGQIVEAAGPFPPFPPSLSGPSKTIVVPLEFSTER